MRAAARILCIGGSDSCGGAGIQADIKTVTMLGGYAMTAITAITAQNSRGVTNIERLSAALVIAQIDAVVSDIGVDAIKIGMIGSAEIARALVTRLRAFTVPIVFDPVMIATSGAALADAETVSVFEQLLRIAAVVTPNLPECAALGGPEAIARAGCAVLVKGGHGEGEMIIDRLIDTTGEIARWSDTRIVTRHTHGTGCTLASALACGLGEGMPLEAATERARMFVRAALQAAPGFGAGAGPMGHFAVRDLPC